MIKWRKKAEGTSRDRPTYADKYVNISINLISTEVKTTYYIRQNKLMHMTKNVNYTAKNFHKHLGHTITKHPALIIVLCCFLFFSPFTSFLVLFVEVHFARTQMLYLRQ